MKKLLKKLQPFMNLPKDTTLIPNLTMKDENIYDLKVSGTVESVGIIQLTLDGQLKMFAEFCEEELDESRKILTKDKIQLITEKFLKECFPLEVSNLHLDAATDLDFFYVFEYVQKDVQLNLPLPNSGINFFMFKNGSIMDMTSHLGGMTIDYPKNRLTAERAKGIFLKNMSPELKIMRYDDEIYFNGDNSIVPAYDFISRTDIDVKMDGTKTTLVDLGDEPVTYTPIPEVVIDSTDIYSFINLEGRQKILTVGDVDVWSKQSLQYFKEQEDLDEEDFIDMDYGVEGLIKIKMDPKREELLELISLAEEDGSALMSSDLAYDKALQILFTQFPNAHHSFKKREVDPEVRDFDDQGDELPPHAYEFTFERFVKDIQVVDEYMSITFCASNLDLIKYHTTNNAFDDFSNVVDVLPANQENAMNIFIDSFEMELHWSKNYENDLESSRYELVYLPVFKGTGGHIHYINAVTLEPWIVDIGD